MEESLRVLGVFKTADQMDTLLEALHERGYKRGDIKLVANHPLKHKLEKQADVYNQSDVDPTDDEDLGPNEKSGVYIHFSTEEELREEFEKNHPGQNSTWFSRLLDAFTYGKYLTEEQEMLIRDHQADVTAGHIVVLLNDRHVAPEKRYYLS